MASAGAEATTDRLAEIRRGFALGEDTAFLLAEVDRLRAQVAHYEHMVGWGVSCSNCANLLDSSYAETVRREEAEATIARVREYCTPLAAADHVGRYTYGPILAMLPATVDDEPLSPPQQVAGCACGVTAEHGPHEDALDGLSVEELDDLVMRQQVARMAGEDPDAVPLRRKKS